MNFKSKGAYQAWLGYVHANGLAESTPGNQSVSIKGKPHQVQHALGGELNQFNEGGTHEQNPIGGIPMGQGDNGNMNTVEQGETMKDNFVYSDRITLTPDVIAQFNLPKSLAGKTVADATKIIDKKFEGREDRISNSTKQNLLDRTSAAQESIKAKQEELAQSMQANSTEVPDQMGGQVPQGMEEYVEGSQSNPQEESQEAPQQMAYGGYVQNKYFLGGATMPSTGQAGAIVGGGTALYGMGKEIFGKSDVDTTGINGPSYGADAGKSAMSGALKGATTGASVGSAFGPYGTAIGAGVGLLGGGVASLIGGKKDEKAEELNNENFYQGQVNKWNSSYAYGGKMNSYAKGGVPELLDPNYGLRPTVEQTTGMDFGSAMFKPTTTIPQVNAQNTTVAPQQPNWYTNNPPVGSTSLMNPEPAGPSVTDKLKQGAGKVTNWMGENYGNLLHYAPVAMNAYQLSKMGKPEVERIARLGNRFKPEYVDERSMQNLAQNEMQNQVSALTEMGGSPGATRNAILGAGLNKTKALSEAYANAAAQNRATNLQGQQFNLGVDQANVAQGNLEGDINARNRGAFATQKSKLLGEIGTNLGSIGKEEIYKKMAKDMFGYTYNGKYYVNSQGETKTPEEMKAEIDKQSQEKKAYGGFLGKSVKNKFKY